MDKADFSGTIKKSGLKSTKSRCAILDVLQSSKRPISAEEVYAELKNKDISLNLSTSTGAPRLDRENLAAKLT
jgi:Fur family ferric uptake transcriptional regulator